MSYLNYLPSSLFNPIYLYGVFLLCLSTSLYYASASSDKVLNNHRHAFMPTLLLALFFVLLLGSRSTAKIDMLYFGDTWLYAHSYNNMINQYANINIETEWLWNNIAYFCKINKFDEHAYFLVIEALYVLPMFVCCWLLMRNNTWLAMLFCLISFSFYGYAINGIRNGMACSLMMVSIALVTKDNLGKLMAILLMVAAYGVHNSTILISSCVLISVWVIREPKYAIAFWGISILISLIAGNFVGDFFEGLDFDERTHYFKDVEDTREAYKFSATGFRFDFVIYSVVPIVFVWYLTMKRNFQDVTYNLIANTYILANAFWVMVIRASYSNRFAYLSWFLYPIVLAYPLLRFKIWDEQSRYTAVILLLYSSFTLFMFFRG